MSERDELAKMLFIADNHESTNPEHEWEMSLRHNAPYTEYTYLFADAILAAGYRKLDKVEWGIFRANDPNQSSPCDNLTYKTREGAELARTTQFLQPEFWEVRGRSVTQWNKQEEESK